ncbi:MAG: sulfurtransferase [Desulfobulbaceae bacterium]|nr:sulfurtransferase [Desulfobulbaceae bacterium]
MTADQARVFLKENAAEAIQLLDVRQPREYEAHHLPGALLIPLKELLSRINELDAKKTTLVYCASGVRSKAACQILMSQNYKDVYNLTGGIKAWNGLTAKGAEDMGMEFFTSGEYKDAFTMAYKMEDGLQQLYFAFADTSRNEEQKKMLLKLASFEDKHKTKLVEDFKPAEADIPKQGDAGNVMEGGFSREMILKHFKPHLYDQEDILNLAMMLETQAHDLYSRIASKSDDEVTKKLFFHLAEEEKQHLSFIARELDVLLNSNRNEPQKNE